MRTMAALGYPLSNVNPDTLYILLAPAIADAKPGVIYELVEIISNNSTDAGCLLDDENLPAIICCIDAGKGTRDV